MSQRLSKRSLEQIEAVVRAARRLGGRDRLPARRAELLRAYFGDVSEEDLNAGDPAYLAHAAMSHLSWAAQRRRGNAKVRVFNPDPAKDGWHSDNTIVQIVNDDMPFLVDSVTMCLNEWGHGIRVTLHPRLGFSRSRAGKLEGLEPVERPGGEKIESFIHIEIGKELDAKDLSGLKASLESALHDVRAAVADWRAMLAALRDGTTALRANAPRLPGLLEESCELLSWLADDHFTLLGHREYRLRRGERKDRLLPIAGSGLGLLNESRDGAGKPIELTGEARRELRSRSPLVITKSHRRSTVHRSGYLDQINIKVFDDGGRPCGERRVLGLFTSVSYSESAREVPLVRLKVAEVMRRSGIEPKSHRGKTLQHVLDTFPRDDLFQISIGDLSRISLGVLNLQERHQVRLFCRRDSLSRFYSCFVFLPKDHYSAQARKRVEQILLKAFDGTSIDTRLTISESVLARLEATIRTSPARRRSAPNLAELEARIAGAVETWSDRLRAALLERLGEVEALELHRRFAGMFPASYQADAAPDSACEDVQTLARLLDEDGALETSVARAKGGEGDRLRFAVFSRGRSIPLYTVVPILERMGMLVLRESVHEISGPQPTAWIQVFEIAPMALAPVDIYRISDRFREGFAAVLDGLAENDRFNAFIALSGLHWHEAALLRAYCKYLLQTGISFSQIYMQQVLARYPQFAHDLVAKFHTGFDPDLNAEDRGTLERSCEESIAVTLDRVTNLDEDRILRAFLGVFEATLRTNFYRFDQNQPKPYISFKLDSRKVIELPRPRPMFEIFVYAPRVEGVHLRCGPVSRGGLRWSDRREDFRTEVLGLMKAQNVKNAVIVPAGAKGGFVCKQLPEGDQQALHTEVIECYKTFIRGMLDLTDNVVAGEIVKPYRVICKDADDPYLVVAADKGTASFSDIANRISAEYEFWLGDAFASGGSTGYDHKKMGITAKGAWESVKRHFREIGVDVEREAFTALGIGDMSGDVFGNGMLLSKHVRLVAAFNHMHIFLDPDPDPKAGYAERKRLFSLKRSTWNDYRREAISMGGGIYSRRVKEVKLHPAARKLLGIEHATLTPPELIKAILRLRADLLWNGGIGTYVKASTESHGDVGDPSNDAVRVNANELKCRVVAEGGNLGFTQRARVEFALNGGQINTDFIDNSGGVDTSDREVNIKILLDQVVVAGKLSGARRNALLAAMTGEIAGLVLEDNYAQTRVLSMMSTRSVERIGELTRLLRELETGGLLDRALEYLPSDEALAERLNAGNSLTRPELAIILSYSKIALIDRLLRTDLPEDACLAEELERYFPARLTKQFADALQQHRLRREIIAMRIAGDVINHMGPPFVFRAVEDTGSSVAQVARAYAIAREVFEIRPMWAAIEAADRQIATDVQYDLMFEISRMIRRAVYWFLKRYPEKLDIAAMVQSMRPGIGLIAQRVFSLESVAGERRLRKHLERLTAAGVDPDLAQRMVALTVMTQSLDIIEVARDCGLDVAEAAQLYFELSRGLRIGRIRHAIEGLEVQGRWRAIARATLRENLAAQQSAVLRKIVAGRGRCGPRDALAAWLAESKDEIRRVRGIWADMEAAGPLDFATLSVAIREIERLT